MAGVARVCKQHWNTPASNWPRPALRRMSQGLKTTAKTDSVLRPRPASRRGDEGLKSLAAKWSNQGSTGVKPAGAELRGDFVSGTGGLGCTGGLGFRNSARAWHTMHLTPDTTASGWASAHRVKICSRYPDCNANAGTRRADAQPLASESRSSAPLRSTSPRLVFRHGTAGEGLDSESQVTRIATRRLLCLAPAAFVQWRGLKEFQRRAGYVSALISGSSATNQGIDIPRSP